MNISNMKNIRYSIIGIIAMLSVNLAAFAQQLKLGKNPYTIEKAAVLETQSDNQGILFPRITDTALINSLSPSDGMVIYHTLTKKLLIRSNGRWTTVAVSTDLSPSWLVAGNANGSIKKLGNSDNYDLPFITNNIERLRILSSGFIGVNTNAPLQQFDVNGNMNLRGAFMPGNNAGTAGYVLSSKGTGLAPEWRQLSLSDLSDTRITTPLAGQFLMYSGTKWVDTTINYLSSIDTSNISDFSLKVRSLFSATAPLSLNNGNFSISQSGTSTNGYLSSTDWNTFNNKAAAFTKGNLTESGSSILTITNGAGAVIGAGTSLQVKQANASQAGFLSASDWTTFNNKLSTVDTGNISNFYIKVRSEFRAGSGISYDAGTGTISSNALTSIDTSNIANFSIKVRSLFSATAPLTLTNGVIGIGQAGTSTNGYLSSTDWNIFNSKAAAFTKGNLTETGSSVLTITNGAGAIIGTGTSVQVKQAGASQAGFLTAADWTTFNNKLSSVDTSDISNFSIKVRSLFKAGSGITYDAPSGTFSSSVGNNFWSLSGNTTGAIQKFGTVDNYDIPFVTNNIERMRLTNSGRLGIGVNAPAAMLHVTAPAGATPLYLAGLAIGSTQDSILTINAGIVKKIAYSSLPTASPTAGNSWSTTGNSGISASTNFLGTTDQNPLMIRVGNQNSGRIDFNNTFLGYQSGYTNPGTNNTGIGYHALFANNGGQYNAALGFNSLNNATGSYNIGIGNAADVVNGSSNSISIGNAAYITASKSIAIGATAQVQMSGTDGIAIGSNSYVTGSNSVAIGNTAQAQAATALALGYSAYTSSSNGIAVGSNTDASGINTMAIGFTAKASGISSLAIGESSLSQGTNGIVIGKDAFGSGQYSISIGSGATGTRSQGTAAIAIGSVTSSFGVNSVGLGNGLVVNGVNSVALGTNSGTNGTSSVAVGDNAKTNGASAVAIGTNTVSNGSASIALGNNSSSIGVGSIVIGSAASGGGTGTDIIALGSNVNMTAAGNNSIAIGKGASVINAVTNAVAFGPGAQASRSNTIIIGDATNAATVVGIGTSAPNASAKLDVSGSFEMGSAGTLTKNIVNFEDNLPGSGLILVSGNKEYDITIPNAANYLSSTRATVNVSFNNDLPYGVSLASARMINNSTVRIRLQNSNSILTTVPGMKAYISIIEF